MKFATVLVFVLLSATQLGADTLLPDYVGTWRSDKELTMASVRDSPHLSADRRAEYEEADIFGKLTVVFRETEMAAYFDDDSTHEFTHIDIVEFDENYVTFRFPTTVASVQLEQTWFFDGDVAYSFVSNHRFKEFFRRVSK